MEFRDPTSSRFIWKIKSEMYIENKLAVCKRYMKKERFGAHTGVHIVVCYCFVYTCYAVVYDVVFGVHAQLCALCGAYS